jgi:hypothetical protein
MEIVEKVLRLYREKYNDFNVLHFHEKLVADEGMDLSYTWVKTALQTAGLRPRDRKRGPHRKRRPRRPLPGMLLHVDGSKHAWLGGLSLYDLITVSDDATSRVYYAQLVEEESTATVMAALKAVVETQGVFCSLYADRGSHFVYTPKAGGPPDRSKPTQIERALNSLGSELIAAHSPQARGRCERAYRTWQGRLPQELRLRGITTLEGANRFLSEEYNQAFNESFAVAAAQEGTAFMPYIGQDLDKIFSRHEEHTVNNDNTVRTGGLVLQLEPQKFRFSMAKCRVLVCRHLDETLSVHFGPHVLGRYNRDGSVLAVPEARTRRTRKKAA